MVQVLITRAAASTPSTTRVIFYYSSTH